MSEDSKVCHYFKFIALAFSITYYMLKDQDITRVILLTLFLLCVFTIQIVLDRHQSIAKDHNLSRTMVIKRIQLAISIFSLLLIWIQSQDVFAFVSTVVIISLLKSIEDTKQFLSIASISLLLVFYIQQLSPLILLISLLFAVFMLLCILLSHKLKLFKDKVLL